MNSRIKQKFSPEQNCLDLELGKVELVIKKTDPERLQYEDPNEGFPEIISSEDCLYLLDEELHPDYCFEDE